MANEELGKGKIKKINFVKERMADTEFNVRGKRFAKRVERGIANVASGRGIVNVASAIGSKVSDAWGYVKKNPDDAAFYAQMVGGIGAGIMKGWAQYHESKFQQSQAEYNQSMASMQATSALDVGETQAFDIARQGRHLEAQQKMVQAGSGLDLHTGTAAIIREQDKLSNQLDQDRVRSNAWNEATAMESRAEQYGMEADFAGITAHQRRIGSTVDALQTAARDYVDFRRDKADTKRKEEDLKQKKLQTKIARMPEKKEGSV